MSSSDDDDDGYGYSPQALDDDLFVANVSCRNESLVRYGKGLGLLPGGFWITENGTEYWNGTDCVEAPLRETHAFPLPLGILVPAVAALLGVCLLGAACYGLERRRKRLMRVYANAPASLTEDNQGFLWRLLLTLFELVQSVLWDCCGITMARKLDRTAYLSTKYNDYSGATFKAFVELKINGDDRLKWLDAWATLDGDGSNLVDLPEFLKFFELRRTTYARRLFDTFNTDCTGAIPLRDFLVRTWATCACDRVCVERVAFALLSRSKQWPGEDVSTIDHKDVERWVTFRYGLKHTNARKKAFQVFKYIDADGSGGISFSEFAEFGRKNLVFVAFGQFYVEKMRAKLFGDAYWAKQTAKRKKMYALDKNFQKEIAAYAKARYDPAKTPSFWDDFPEVYEHCVALARKKAGTAKTLESLHVTMRADLHRRLIKALENLCTDSQSLSGAFYRWRSRAAQMTSMIRAVEEVTGGNENEEKKTLDAAVHEAIVASCDRITPRHKLIEDVYYGTRRSQERKRTREAQFAAAQSGVIRVAPMAPEDHRAIRASREPAFGGGIAISPFAGKRVLGIR